MKGLILLTAVVLLVVSVEAEGCPKGCSGHGLCFDGKCYCRAGYSGVDCASQRESSPKGVESPKGEESCPGGCSGHGDCCLQTKMCKCDPGWEGEKCERESTDPLYAHRHGHTNTANKKPCPNNCMNNGVCHTRTGKCHCYNGFTGIDCAITVKNYKFSTVCPKDCSGHGTCQPQGTCLCNPGWNGEACDAQVDVLEEPTAEDKANNDASTPVEVKASPKNITAPMTTKTESTKKEELVKTAPSAVDNTKPATASANKTTPVVETVEADAVTSSPKIEEAPKVTDKCCVPECVHGTCDGSIGKCVCDIGYMGDDCSEIQPAEPCPNDCSGRGQCLRGQCLCNPGYMGADCSTVKKPCDNNCWGHGICLNGECHCDPGWSGNDCGDAMGDPRSEEDIKCLNDCSGHGTCDMGKCTCAAGFQGTDCSHLTPQNTCPRACGGHGVCNNGVCKCEKGFTGEDCGVEICDGECSGNGKCVGNKCVCDEGFGGHHCGLALCPENCNARGVCVSATCYCHDGFSGVACERGSSTCSKKCGLHGKCTNSTCVCNAGWTGSECSIRACPKSCSLNGRCVNGTCACAEGWTGIDCSQVAPSVKANATKTADAAPIKPVNVTSEMDTAKSSSKQPKCVMPESKKVNETVPVKEEPAEESNSGGVMVDVNQINDDHLAPLLPEEACGNNGIMYEGACYCKAGYFGSGCHIRVCPGDCNGHGECQDSKCKCEEGWEGYNCHIKTCPLGCGKNGYCDNGTCVCAPNVGGATCARVGCPNECGDTGTCFNGTCFCEPGYTGDDCSIKTCPNNCSGQGTCHDGVCVCNAGFDGASCSKTDTRAVFRLCSIHCFYHCGRQCGTAASATFPYYQQQSRA